MKLPEGYEAHVSSRSSTFQKWGIMLTNGIGIIDNSYSDYLLVAILNSKLMNFYYNRKLITNADVFPYIKGVHIKSFPIPKKHTNSTIEKK